MVLTLTLIGSGSVAHATLTRWVTHQRYPVVELEFYVQLPDGYRGRDAVRLAAEQLLELLEE